MGLKHYSLLKGTLIDYQEERDNDTPHFQVKVDENGNLYRIAVNVLSAAQPSELKYIVISDFSHTMTDELSKLEHGLHSVKSEKNGIALDYIRGNLFDINSMKLIPHTQTGPDNDLNDLLKMYSDRAKKQNGPIIYAFGEKWPTSNRPDRYFGFSPGQGIHDIHMNQGNSGRWKNDNGVYQDGGLLFYFPENKQWIGIFLAFQSQAIHTDDKTGHPLDTQPDDIHTTGKIRIVAALVNPKGDDYGKETVTLLNVSNDDIDLKDWKLLNHRKDSKILLTQTLAAGDSLKIELTGQDIQLGNKGGQITLLTPQGLKADGVSYSRSQIRRQGWTLIF
ncbi:hypothetical protein SCALIN_C10_0069 [Candidatus Scalindua japonica]|uniref:LTD domain-containing protein n=1 Tax=Candidatus Scalindua japonica TaxID=1284222 RepID=A0A286TWP6_9BACT|nr:DUF2278 family protein [Candidatus Scalindua japonica]GAX60309.1 hypothetical protein SCALIN_C10_0069 [Candidatus Scalindua japonica]